ncbi:uncharacterized protein LOC143259844 [Megalopta genalis]|uniref:uncharacterized protein LOC143259844 n=1 Tax=Megalopta genalis TaxID=115081 RepID=UPI003FD3268D
MVGKSHSTIQYIVRKYKEEGCVVNKLRTGRPKNLGTREGNFMLRKIKAEPTTSATGIATELRELDRIYVHAETIRRTEHRNNFHARTARHKVFVSETNRKKRLKKKVWRRLGISGMGLHESAKDTGNLHIIGVMDKFVYLNILKDNLKISAEKFGILNDNNFYQDKEPKHKSYLVQWLIYNIPHVLTTPPQLLNFNPVEHLWEELDRKIRTTPISNREELKQHFKI